MPILDMTPAGKIENKMSNSALAKVCEAYRERIIALHTPQEPKVSIIIPAFNEEDYILNTLRSLSHLKTQHPLEIIGVNNSSTDRTGDILEQCGVTVIHEAKKGTSYARQAGLEAAQGEYIFTTDADTLVPTTWVEKSLQYFTQHANLVFLSGGHAQTGTHWSFQGTKFFLNTYRYLLGRGYKNSSCFSGANSVFRRNIACQVGGYEPGVDKGEDVLLARKIGKHGKILGVYDDEEIRVQTSGRRFSTLIKVGKHALNWAPGGTPMSSKEFGKKTFQDVR